MIIEIFKQKIDPKMFKILFSCHASVNNYQHWSHGNTYIIWYMVKTASNFCTFYSTFSLQEKGQKVAKICLTRSQSTVKFSQRPLFTFTLKVNEQFWKFPEGRTAPGLRPFDDSKFSSCLVNRGLCSPEGCCAATEDGAVTAPEVDWLSSPWMKEVKAADICLNWLSVGRSQ